MHYWLGFNDALMANTTFSIYSLSRPPFKKLQIQLSILKPKLTNPSHANDIYIYIIHDILLLTLIRNINLMI